MSSYIGFSLYKPLVGHLNRVGNPDRRHVVIRSVVQQPPVNELIVCATAELRVGLIDRIKRPRSPNLSFTTDSLPSAE